MKPSVPDLSHERDLVSRYGLPFIAIDEAGRGPLAGPLSVSGVLVEDLADLLIVKGINDSKKLSEARREKLFTELTAKLNFKNILISPGEIDELGLTKCLHKAANSVINFHLPKSPNFIMLDGKHDYIKHGVLKTFTIVKGDGACLSIAVASIHAKVSRDRVMTDLDKVNPGYGFSRNKGYGTLEHREAIANMGLSSAHRKSFTEKFVNE